MDLLFPLIILVTIIISFWVSYHFATREKKVKIVVPDKLICPYCSCEVKNYHSDFYVAPHCDNCGSNFITQEEKRVEYDSYGNVSHTKTIRAYYPNGIPELQDDNEDFQTLLKKYKISEEHFIKSTVLISYTVDNRILLAPYPLLKTIDKVYSGHLGYNPSFTLQELFNYLDFQSIEDRVLTKKEITFKDLPDYLSGLDRGYDQWYIECCYGGGWMRPYYMSYFYLQYCVRNKPPDPNLEEAILHMENYAKEQQLLPASIDPPQQPFYRDIKYISSLEFDVWRTNAEQNYLFLKNKFGPVEWCCFNIILTDTDNITPSQMELFWSHLQKTKHYLIFEIIADGDTDKVVFQFLCRKDDKSKVANELAQLFPESINVKGNDVDYWSAKGLKDRFGMGIHFGLARHYSYQIRTFTNFNDGDPLFPLVHALSEIEKGQQTILQFMIEPSTSGRDKRLLNIDKYSSTSKAREENPGAALFAGYPLSQKVKYPLFAVCMNLVIIDEKEAESRKEYWKSVENSLSVFSAPENNRITTKINLTDSGNKIFQNFDIYGSYLRDIEMGYLINRITTRHGFILNTLELANLCHFPSKSLTHPKLLRKDKSVKIPERFQKGEIAIGQQADGTEAWIPAEDRTMHTYILGRSGMGKTTLLVNMISQDIKAGRGIGVIDVKGEDMIEEILKIIPPERVNDVILFDITDEKHPFSFNILNVKKEKQSQAIQQIVYIFERATGDPMPSQMANFCMALVDAVVKNKKIYTLEDVRDMLHDEFLLREVIDGIEDSRSLKYWETAYKKVSDASKDGIYRRLSPILLDPTAYNILCQKEMKIDFDDIMNNKKIFLAKIPLGRYPYSYKFYSSLLMAKIQLTAMSRTQAVKSPFYLYVDEFQNFADETFEKIIDQARSAQLHLTLSHQRAVQVEGKILSACKGAGTIILLPVEDDDVARFVRNFQHFNEKDITALRRFEALVRIGSAIDDFKIRTLSPVSEKYNLSDKIRQNCREKYCMKISDIPKPEPKQEKLYE